MAENALEARPPLGTIRDFVVDRSRDHHGTIDLKMAGSLLFSDAARILALARGVPHTSTAQRLRSVAEFGFFGRETLAAMLDGFHFIHRLRLRTQSREDGASRGANRIDPRELNDLDRQVLKESLRQAQKLQGCLVREYQLGG
jgi:CBS domain-containing protein